MIEGAGGSTRGRNHGKRVNGASARQDYTVCYWLMEESEPYSLRLAFDVMDFNPQASATATLFLDNVKVETLSRQ